MITYKIQLKTIEDFRKYVNMVEKNQHYHFSGTYILSKYPTIPI